VLNRMRSRSLLVCGLLLLLCGAECASIGRAVRGAATESASRKRGGANALLEVSAAQSRSLIASKAKLIDPLTLTLLASIAVVLVNMAKKAWGAYQAYKAAMEELSALELESKRVACELRLDAYRLLRVLKMQVDFVDTVLSNLPPSEGVNDPADAESGGASCLATHTRPLDLALLSSLPAAARTAMADMWYRLATVERAVSVEGGLQCLARRSNEVTRESLRDLLNDIKGSSGPVEQLRVQVETSLKACLRDEDTGTYLLGPLRLVEQQLAPAPVMSSAIRPAGTTVGSTSVAQTRDPSELMPDDDQEEAGENVAAAASAIFSPDEAEEMTGHSALAMGLAFVMVGFNKAIDVALEKILTARAAQAHGAICSEMVRADEVTHNVADVSLSVVGLIRTFIYQSAAAEDAAAEEARRMGGGHGAATGTGTGALEATSSFSSTATMVSTSGSSFVPPLKSAAEIDPMVHEAIRMAYLYDASDPIEELRTDTDRPNRLAEASFAERMVEVLQHPLLPDRFRQRLLASPRVFHFLDAMMAIAEADAAKAISRSHDTTRSFACPMLDVEQTAFNYFLRELPVKGATKLSDRLDKVRAEATTTPCKLSDLAYSTALSAFVALNDLATQKAWYKKVMGSDPKSDLPHEIFCPVAVDKFYVEHYVNTKVSAGSPIATVLFQKEKERCMEVAAKFIPKLGITKSTKPSYAEFVIWFQGRLKDALGLVGNSKVDWKVLSVTYAMAKVFVKGASSGEVAGSNIGPPLMKAAWDTVAALRSAVRTGSARCAGMDEFPRFLLTEWEDQGDRESLWFLELLRSISSSMAVFMSGSKYLTREVLERAAAQMGLAIAG